MHQASPTTKQSIIVLLQIVSQLFPLQAHLAALKCKHCGGKVLETMHPALSPKELFDLCTKLKQDGAEGCLVSGGCLPDGSVPLDGFVGALGRIKRELGLTVFVHTGIINFDTAFSLKQAGVDAALIDVIGSAETIKKICNFTFSPKDYAESLKALDKAELPFVPHVIVGLNEGQIRWRTRSAQNDKPS